MPSGEDCQGRADGVDSDEEGGLRVDDEIYIPPPPRALGELDASRPRLVIAKIVNVNFKSYAGTQVVGPFHKCFSAIVGPNGSGKSNVIDSMLFVFGYRATKIRSKKISVLIHNSSEHPNVSSCSVSVHFQRIIDKPGADYEVVPDSEFVISRTAFKDNSSYYELNRKRVQFKDIARLLRSHGVDLDHNRFLILQGEVEQIAMMKPKGQNDGDTGMLEFLEDIIGTGRYKEPLEKLFEKVELLSERRLEKLNRLRIVEKEKASLEQPMQEVLQYLKLENAAIRLEHQYHQFQRFNVTKESEAQAEKVAEAEADLGKLVDEMKLVQAEKAEAAKRMKERSEHWDGLQKEKDQATARFDKVKRQDEALHAELVETNKRRKANQQTLKAERSKVEELQRVPEKNAKDIKECEDLAEKLTLDREKEEASLAKTMAGLKEKTEPLLEKRSKLEQKLISLRKNVDQAQATFDLASSELQLYQSLEEKETRKLEDLRKLLKDTEDTLKLRNSQLDSLDKKIPATKTSLQKAQEELRQLKDQEAKATAELKGMRVKFEEKRSAMQANTSRNRILEALMQEKREGRIPGIFGRLGDLGAIDSKYDVAISTACGPLDNIVVDTVSTAQACIGYLRANDIGRATFIPLEKQQRFLARCTQKLDTPEEVPRLFDLVKVDDPRVLPAFYYGLQDTLVADDLEQATRIGYGPRRFRVVTLKGELIELSGTMSGGGRTVLRGRMGQRVKDDRIGVKDIEQLQAELDGVYQRCTELRMRFNPLEEQIWTLETALKDMTVDREKYCIQTRTLREQEPSIRKQVETQEVVARNAVSDPEKVERLNEAVEAAKEKLEEAQEDSRATEEQVKRINKEIDNITGDRVKSQQKKIAALTSQIDKSRAEACRLQVAIKTSERNLKKAEKHIETLEADVKACEDRLREMQTQKQKLEDDARAILDELTLVTEALQERDEAISGLREEVSNLQARENRMKSVRIDLDERLKSYRSSLKDLQNAIPALTSKIKSLKLQEVPGEVQEDLQELSEEELSELNEKALQANLQKARRRLPSELPNMRILAEYREKDAAYLARAADLEATTADRDRVREVYETARRRRVQEFLAGFHQITDKLKEMYQMITLGGDAELELVDSLDPFSEGILFSVRPPRKSWKNICNLSGGEKTLSSLALVFALHHYKPTPLYFMDEIDAALDFKNVSIVGNYIKERTKNAQFIVISLRSNMFELADYLVGIYKTFNCTKSVTVDLARYYEKNGIAPPTQITSKSYSSQVLKYSQSQAVKSSQKAANNNNENNESNEDVQSNGDKEGNNRLSLPDLSICPTPEKNPNPKQSAIEEEPQKKKRRLQQQQK